MYSSTSEAKHNKFFSRRHQTNEANTEARNKWFSRKAWKLARAHASQPPGTKPNPKGHQPHKAAKFALKKSN